MLNKIIDKEIFKTDCIFIKIKGSRKFLDSSGKLLMNIGDLICLIKNFFHLI